jgi:hypothetical protein
LPLVKNSEPNQNESAIFAALIESYARKKEVGPLCSNEGISQYH